MRKKRGLSLHMKLLASFLAVIFVFSIIHLFSYARLLSTMSEDAKRSANERLISAATRLDACLSQIRNDYFALSYTPSFRKASRSASLSSWDLVELKNQASLYFDNHELVAAFAILFQNSGQMVTSSGNYDDSTFFSQYYTSDRYSPEFWQQETYASFAQRCYPAALFSRKSSLPVSAPTLLMPMAFKPYWDGDLMLLLLIDVEALCEQADLYLTEDFYIFDSSGMPLLSLDGQQRLTQAPNTQESVFEWEGGYISQRQSSFDDLTYVKLLDESAIMGQLSSSLYFSLFTAIAALILGVVIAAVSVRRLMHPVQEILHLFSSGEGAPQQGVDELRYIQANVEQIVRQRDQYVQQLSRKDAALSGFLLQSQLKNVVVDLDAPDEVDPASSKTVFILYCRAHYRSGALEAIAYPPQTVAYLLQEILNQELSKRFDAALIFQLEPNQFVAKVSVPASRQDIREEMQQLMQRLENEKDFVFFTVVQSMPLSADGDFTAVYSQVLDAAQYALVNNRTQLLQLPLELSDPGRFCFSAEQEQQLRTLIGDGRADEAQTLTAQILEANLTRGIRRIHMILLCSAVTSAALRALSELYSQKEPPSLNSSGVYNELPRCDTDRDYLELVGGFVRSAALCAAENGPETDSILEGVRSFLAKNYQREFSMDDLAGALHLSKNYLSTYFKGKTGTNLSEHIQFYRIQKAIELLKDPSLKIGDIGGMVGISNINTFLRQFKKYTGMTPREYRMQKVFPQ